jgi:hypothetical protein
MRVFNRVPMAKKAVMISRIINSMKNAIEVPIIIKRIVFSTVYNGFGLNF